MKDRFAVSMFGQKRLSREGGIEIVVKELCTRMARDGLWNWYKANPSLGQTIQIQRVRDAYQEALDNPAEENVFKQLRLNMWVSSLTRFIPEHIYDLGNQPIDMEALKGRDCYGGLDLSSTGDM